MKIVIKVKIIIIWVFSKFLNSSGSKTEMTERNSSNILFNHQTEMKNSNIDNQLMDIVRLERGALNKLDNLNRELKHKMK